MAARIAMIAMTTKSSIRVNALRCMGYSSARNPIVERGAPDNPSLFTGK
jgi:hypothetical protein